MEQQPNLPQTEDKSDSSPAAERKLPRLKAWELALSTFGALLFCGSSYLYLSETSIREILFGEDLDRQQKIGEVKQVRGALKRELANSMAFKPIASKSEVFHRDTVMTDAYSSAEIELDDGNIIELGPSTMVKLIAGTQSVLGGVSFPKIEVVSGALKVKAVTGEVRVRSRAHEVRIEKQMARQIAVATDRPIANPSNAALLKTSLEVPINRADELKISDPAPRPSPNPSPLPIAIAAKLPEPSPSPSPIPTPVPTPKVQTAQPIPKPTLKAAPPKPKPTVTAKVTPTPKPTPVVHIPLPTEPTNDQKFSIAAYKAKGTGVLLTWHKAVGADGYTIEIARDEAMSSVVIKTDLLNNFYVFKPVAPGKFWWRVRSTRGENGEFDSRPSGVFRFIMEP